MPDRNTQGRIMSASYSSTAAITSDDLYAARKISTKVTIFVFSSQAGTVQIQYLDDALVARNLTATLAVSASDLTVLNFDHKIPRLRAIFTPSAATPGTVTIDAYMS